jgi:hypothetical protein
MKKQKFKKLKQPDFSVEIYPGEREVLKEVYLRFLAGRVEDRNIYDLYPPEILASLEEKGLLAVERGGGKDDDDWFITSDGVWLGRILVSEKTPFEKAFIKPTNREHN